MGLGSMPQYAATMGPVPQPAQVGQTSGETSGVERNTGPPIQGQHHAGGPTMSRMTKLKFPRFNGTRLRTLLYKLLRDGHSEIHGSASGFTVLP
ncbi:hypothetical protein P3L10_025880 [Capsicum annuum]